MKLRIPSLTILVLTLSLGAIALQSAHLWAGSPEEPEPASAGRAEETAPVVSEPATETVSPLTAKLREVLAAEESDVAALAAELASTQDLEHRRVLQMTIDLRKQESELRVMELQLEALTAHGKVEQAAELAPVVERMRGDLQTTRENHERRGVAPRSER